MQRILISIFLICGYFTILTGQCLTEAHSNYEPDSWQSCEKNPNPNLARDNTHWVLYDLGQVYTITGYHVWNYNVDGETERGFRNTAIDYSMDGTNWTELISEEIPQAPGTNNYMGIPGSSIAQTDAKYILVTALSGWAQNDSCLGLSEIKFSVKNCSIFDVESTETINASCNGANDGALEVLANGGVGPYSYSWSNGASEEKNQNLLAGTYTVTVTDGNGCQISKDFAVNEPTIPGITCLSDDTVSVNLNCEAIIPDFTNMIDVYQCGFSVSQFPAAGNLILGCGIDTIMELVVDYTSGPNDTCSFLLTTTDVICCPLNTDSVLYVNHLATGKNTGLSWSDASQTVQKAILVAQSCAFVKEIWVASGTYYTTKSTDRFSKFDFLSSLKIYGGFSGNETMVSQRDFMSNETKLSGDIGTQGNSGDNALHIMHLGTGINNLMVDGFEIEYGMANGGGIDSRGSGFVNHGDLMLRNITFSNCNGLADGSILYNEGADANLILENCTIIFNPDDPMPVLNTNNSTMTIKGNTQIIKVNNN